MARGDAPAPEALAQQPSVKVEDLLGPEASLDLSLRAGKGGLDREIFLARVQRPGLALTGYTDYIRYGRVQIVGQSEIGYLTKLAPARRALDPGAPGPLPHLLLHRHQGPRAPAGAPGRGRRGGRARPRHRGGVHPVHQAPLRLPGGEAGAAPPPALGAHGRLRPGRPDHGGERHRQVGVRAGPHRPRPPAGGGRRGGDQAPGRRAWWAPPRTSPATTWSCGAWGSSTSRTSTGCPPSAWPSGWSWW